MKTKIGLPQSVRLSALLGLSANNSVGGCIAYMAAYCFAVAVIALYTFVLIGHDARFTKYVSVSANAPHKKSGIRAILIGINGLYGLSLASGWNCGVRQQSRHIDQIVNVSLRNRLDTRTAPGNEVKSRRISIINPYESYMPFMVSYGPNVHISPKADFRGSLSVFDDLLRSGPESVRVESQKCGDACKYYGAPSDERLIKRLVAVGVGLWGGFGVMSWSRRFYYGGRRRLGIGMEWVGILLVVSGFLLGISGAFSFSWRLWL